MKLTEWVQDWTPPPAAPSPPVPVGGGISAQPSQNRHARADAEPRRPPPQGARAMLRAVMRQALADLADPRTTAEREGYRATAVAWLCGAPALLPFAAVAEHLSLDADAVRAAVSAADPVALRAMRRRLAPESRGRPAGT